MFDNLALLFCDWRTSLSLCTLCVYKGPATAKKHLFAKLVL